jgi:hypothetical protein
VASPLPLSLLNRDILLLSAHPSIEGESIHEKITYLSKLFIFCLIQTASLQYVHKALKTVIHQPSAAATATSRSDAEHCRFIPMNLSV